MGPKIVAFLAGRPLGVLRIGTVTFAEFRFAIGRLTDALRLPY